MFYNRVTHIKKLSNQPQSELKNILFRRVVALMKANGRLGLLLNWSIYTKMMDWKAILLIIINIKAV